MTDHLAALEARLSHERARLAVARTARERDLRAVWVAQCEREIIAEKAFIGCVEPAPCDLTDDELLAELAA